MRPDLHQGTSSEAFPVVELLIERLGEHIDVSVIVPVYNSEGSLPMLISRVKRALAGRSFEILLVNDGSSDRSWEVIRDCAGKDPGIRGMSLMRNYGQHNALLAGVRAARGDISVTLDDDLQHPPEEIPVLLTELSRGFDVVYGTPATLPHSPLRNVAAWTTKLVLQKAIGAETARKVSAFRAFRTDLRKAFEDYRSPYVSIDVLLTWATSKFSAVVVEHRPREIGESQYTLGTLSRHALTMITSFSTLPLRLASLTGLCFTLLGFGVLVYVVATYVVRHGSVPGFPFLASIVAIFSGAQLFALGIIGEYLARIHSRMMERPTYAIAEQVGGRENT
jgi:undecaprenyl-phosphate 4-deoxy-4-formamido-L-arabinose transferase